MSSAIQLQNLRFSYGENEILRGVSFQVEPGEFLGIIGPNGGGKTTLLKLILGFLKPTAGKIEIFGKSPVQAAQQIAYVPQGLHFDRQFPISVLELVYSGRLSKLPWYGIYNLQDKTAVREALEKVGLWEYRHAPFGTLSGGQAQRALIARALVSEPQLLLLDEPTASVDAQAGSIIYSILKDLKGSMTILMVTHDLKVAIDIVERVLCVQGGVLSLMPQQVCEHFALGLYHTPLERGKTIKNER
jgi:zinc transport system ATP-binding protein